MSKIEGDPKTYFFTNPHPRLKPGDRVRIVEGTCLDTEGAVAHYLWTSPRGGDLYNVDLDGHVNNPVGVPFRMLELVEQ
jgi:hypothetical protein